MSELEGYIEQLKHIEDSLANDQENESLKELQKELTDLISLLSEDTEKEEQITYKNTINEDIQRNDHVDETPFKPGDMIYAKPKLEETFKEAKITNISGNLKTVNIQFTESEIIDTYPIDKIYKQKPKLDKAAKYKLQQKKKESSKSKVDNSYETELNNSAQSWQSFSKKKGIKKSQFKTSDKIGSKIGVIGSGGAMSRAKKDKTLGKNRFNPY